jgi:hypothetical protein
MTANNELSSLPDHGRDRNGRYLMLSIIPKYMVFYVFVFILEAVLGFPTPAGAYTDPNLGNLVFQILFPIITIISTGFLIFRNYIKRKVTSLKNHLKEWSSKKSQ